MPAPLDHSTLLGLLSSSPGALLVLPSTSRSVLLEDLQMRLSFDWMLPRRPKARTVAVVGGRDMCDPEGKIHGSQAFFEAAQGLGISLIVFDSPGHWLEGDRFAHLRQQFIATDMSDLVGLSQRIRSSLSRTRVDGLVTFTDAFVTATAEAAELLGLPTEPADAMLKAHHKQEMRKITNAAGMQTLHLQSGQTLDDPDLADSLAELRYPMVIKPCRGQFSRGVLKVTDQFSLAEAVEILRDEDLTNGGLLLETYIDGPEIDANFVLWERKILFLEVTDNFPCLADADTATVSHNFAESVQISNTRLPQSEIEIIKSTLHRNLIELGFCSGVFHVEARMRNSAMQYSITRSDGVLDLLPKASSSDSKEALPYDPEVFLIEVNARPPGTGGTWASLYTYGVDMGAIQFLRALNDRERLEAMSKPFLFTVDSPGDGGGAQYWNAHCILTMHRDNIVVPHDFFARLCIALPDVAPHISRVELHAHPGQVVSPTGGVGWIGYVLLYSRISRSHVVDMYHRIFETSKAILDGICEF
jgi:biotin carboxylase